jgi:phytoene synthase
MLRGRAALAVALFVAGGRAALAAIEQADYDVLSAQPRPGRGLRAKMLVETLRGAGIRVGNPARSRSRSRSRIRTPLDDAYRHCEAITRTRAGNFYYGIRLLPAEKRLAMCAVYAFAREVDDIGDGPEPPERKREQLAALRAGLAGQGASPVVVATADAERRFGLPHDALEDLVAGVEMDVRGERYETFEELLLYCRRVAGTIGRLCLAIFGSADPRAPALAEDLGVALQLTNILRDVREDLGLGRVYLPAEDLRRLGIQDLSSAPDGPFAELVAFEAFRAREWFERGLRLTSLLDARSAACVSAMAGIYLKILERIESEPLRVRRGRVSLSGAEKTLVALRSLLGGRL